MSFDINGTEYIWFGDSLDFGILGILLGIALIFIITIVKGK